MKEEAEFWDTHDATDYLHEFPVELVGPILTGPKAIAVPLAKPAWARLLREAERRRTSAPLLASRLLTEKLAETADQRTARKSRRKKAG